MAKNNKKRAMVYSNVKENKKKAEEISRIKENQINLNDEIVIGLNRLPNDKIPKSKKNVSKKKVQKNRPKSNKPNIKKKMNPVKKKKIIISIKIILVLAILIAGLLFLLKSSLFNIKEVHIKIGNNKVLTESYIKSLSTINIGQNIYSINKKEITESIKTESYVESVKIKRKLPNIVEIEIEERAPKFQLEDNGQYIYVDNQGYILEKSTEKNDCILIKGYTSTDTTDGNRLNNDDLKRLSGVLKILQEAENNGLKSDITSIDISDDSDYKIYFDGLYKMAHLGDTSALNEKMTYIKKILEEESNYEGEIFVNVDLNNGEYPHFREKV